MIIINIETDMDLDDCLEGVKQYKLQGYDIGDGNVRIGDAIIRQIKLEKDSSGMGVNDTKMEFNVTQA